jgi:TolA-binding protein
MKTLICLLTTLACLSGSPITYASSPEQQLAFAEKLLADGDQAFAMLEFKRFLFESPKHVKAPDATLRIAQIQLSYFQNIVDAKATLRTIVANYPNTENARKAKALADYIEVNSDFSGKPLFVMLAGNANEKAGKFSEAAQQYARILSEYPQARLAPEAARNLAVLQLRNFKQVDQARTTLTWITSNHPKHPLVPECELLLAETLELEHGATQEVIAAYRAVAKKYPEHAVAKTATDKASALQKQVFAVERQFDKEFIRPYTVKQQADPQSSQYLVKIEIPRECSDREVKATLEDALIKEGEKRKTPTQQVSIEAYFSYPQTVAGTVTWTPGQTPVYVMPEKKDQDDELKDMLFDLFKRGLG